MDEGIDAFDKGLTAEGMRLIELTPPISGLARVKVSSDNDGQFSHILNHQNLTQSVDFGEDGLITVNRNETVIVVLTNPDDSSIPSLDYEIRHDEIKIEQGSVVINSGAARIEFSNVPENATIRIFNILGQKISTLQNETGNLVQWNLRNHFGNRVPSGTYIYYVKSDDFESAGKLTILR